MRLNLADEIARQIKVLNYPKQGNGIDGMRVDELLTYLQENYEILKENLLSGIYKPLPVKRVEIPNQMEE